MLAQFIDRQAQGSHMKMGSNGATLVAVTEKNVPVEATGKIKEKGRRAMQATGVTLHEVAVVSNYS